MGCHGIPSESVALTMWAPPVFVDPPAAYRATLEGSEVGLQHHGHLSTAELHPSDWGLPPMLISMAAIAYCFLTW